MRWTAAALIAAVTAACGGSGGASPTSPTVPTTPTPSDTLRAAADAQGRFVGTAVQSSLLANGQYSATAGREFNYLTAEYEMKWNVIEPANGVTSFAAGDAIVGYAASQGMRVKGHTLVWHGATPSWVNGLSTADFRAAFERHIRGVAGYYRGRVHAWDVVNEAVADDGSGLRDTVFRQKLGDSYIADAFRLARDADPGARLFYNDYGGEGLSAKANRIYDLVRDLVVAGVPIDGIGLQMHVSAMNRPPDASIAANMRRLADLGLTVHISEMDVRVSGVPGTQQSRLDVQRAAYHDVVRVCVMEPRCEAVTFWGFTDAHTWISGDMPLLFDAQYVAKPSYTGVLDALRGR
ncbi:MAG TPA: endo-1,4-beta-xylanase [Vicinamibacterales bacterium]|nr:endo-1,4-beta-xylanase [Vicinamibacterales bacterium]